MTGTADETATPLGLEEDALVARAQDGDLDAFERLVDAYQGRIFRLGYRMLANREEAEDVVQDTLIAAWRKLPTLASPGAFSGWVYQVATNRCFDLLRQRSTRPSDATDPSDLVEAANSDLPTRSAGSSDPAHEAEITAQMTDLARLLKKIPPEQRACWLLREVHGRSYAEIAHILSIEQSTVRGRIARARIQLAEGMTPWR
ncbi:RNA polymerase sigma factor [Saxibacter everestensis]|uniref:RNA polymerase sigma factor n=1 Tax=Saxibacter everestensis TaxID=2909229 RepID=A0ABY8QU35_9MICO|nr:RNA polymerase sigma factor [Brevibacteriaceae bacterium ZFBP1038]